MSQVEVSKHSDYPVKFNEKPLYGVFSEAAKKMGIKGKNARVIVNKMYKTGNRTAVRIVSKLVRERIEEYKDGQSAIQEVSQFQNSQS